MDWHALKSRITALLDDPAPAGVYDYIHGRWRPPRPGEDPQCQEFYVLSGGVYQCGRDPGHAGQCRIGPRLYQLSGRETERRQLAAPSCAGDVGLQFHQWPRLHWVSGEPVEGGD